MPETPHDIRRIIRNALDEDIGTGDATSLSIFPDSATSVATLVSKQHGVVAGLEIGRLVFAEIDPTATFTTPLSDGTPVQPGDLVGTISGKTRVILSGERTALNFMQRMSGIASLTRLFVEKVKDTGVHILDTRKTAPGLRSIDKMAVRTGGGSNHRAGLFDMVLIKDNHIDECGGIVEAVSRVRSGPHGSLQIEVECRTLDDVRMCLPLHLDRLLLDNMSIPLVRQAVRIVEHSVPLEVSGNVSLDNVRQYAETGVQFISVGALTHSAISLDISMVIDRRMD